jgi:transglutaminase-like putative cysteine protease
MKRWRALLRWASPHAAAQAAAHAVSYRELRALGVCLGLALAAHIAALPVWLTALVAASVAMRLILAARGYAAPSRPVKLGIAAAAIVILFLQFRTFNGLSAGTALLSLVAGLKFLETDARRDLYAVALIVYFLCLAALLRSESFWLLLYLIGVAWLTAAVLLRLAVPAPLRGWPLDLRYVGRISAQALPVAAVLWLFFPRFDAPLWQLPAERGNAQSGLGDSMSPGDIVDLALSDEIAFRVRFDGSLPPRDERYWRGPVLHDTDGHAWRNLGAAAESAATLTPTGPAYSYTLSLEPHAFNWLFALDWPDQWSVPDGHLNADDTLVQSAPVSRALEVSARSHTHVSTAQALTAMSRRRDTQLPSNRNPRTIALAAELRRSHPDDLGFAQAVLEMFHREEFFYTLSPPPLGANSVDDFLFDTRRGFCGHYASAFAMLMRAAGVPARIVTGYYGGTYNPYAGYWIVRQSNAHAWDEIWIGGRGWMRVDPTAAIAPARVESGLDGTLAAEQLGLGIRARVPWITDLRLRLDALGQLWRQRFLGFNQVAQLSLIERLGIEEPDAQKIVLVMAAGLMLAFVWLIWQLRREQHTETKDPAVLAYRRLGRRLAAIGLPRRPHEGAEGYAARVGRARPDLAVTVAALCGSYAQLRYAAPAPGRAADLEAFAAGVRAFHPRSRALPLTCAV